MTAILTFNILHGLSEEDDAVIWKEKGLQLASDFVKKLNIVTTTTRAKQSDCDTEYIEYFKTTLNKLIPKLTIDILRKDHAKDKQ